MAEDKLFVEATEEDVPSIIGLRQRIWSTTYRGIYPDSMIDEFDWDRHREMELLGSITRHIPCTLSERVGKISAI